jgi:hypothetical protein
VSAVQTDAEDAVPAVRRFPQGRLIGGVLAVALILVVGKAYSVWTHPTLFKDQGIEGGAAPTRVKDAIVYAGVALGPERPKQDETITLHSVKAHFKSDGANAVATFAICYSNEPGESITSLEAPTSPKEYCRRLVPVTNGMKVRLQDDGADRKPTYMLMTLKATTPGTSHVDWITVNYTRSWKHWHQHGNDRSKQDWIVKAT